MSKLEVTLIVWAPRVLSILRIVAGLLFFEHGMQKLLGFPPAMRMGPPPGAGGPPPSGLGPLLFGISGYFEFLGGFLFTAGLFTRPVAFILSGMMAVAYFTAHAPRGFFPINNMGEPAILYCFVFFYFFFAGGG